MSYQADRELGKLLFHHRFLDTLREATDPARSKILREAEEARLNRKFTDQEWAAREPEVRAEWKRQAEEGVAEVYRLMQALLRRLPGPQGDSGPPWDAEHQKILQDWVKIPRLCMLALRTFPRSIKELLLDQVPRSEREKYKKDLPALIVWWMIDSARRASRDRQIAKMLRELSQAGASARFVLLLSFVPTLVFHTLFVRRALEADRRRFAPVIKRYKNPRTTLLHNDPWARSLTRLRAAGDPLLKNTTDAEIKQMICEGCRRLPRSQEQEIWSSLGLGRKPRTKLSGQRIWSFLAVPLLDYLEPFPHGRKEVGSLRYSRITPETLFSLGSELLALRSDGLWEDIPTRLKNRWYYRLSRTA